MRGNHRRTVWPALVAGPDRLRELEYDGFCVIGASELIGCIDELAAGAANAFARGELASGCVCQELRKGYRRLGVEYASTPARPDLMESVSLSVHEIGQLSNDHSCAAAELHRAMSDVASGFALLAAQMTSAAARRYSGQAMPTPWRIGRSSFLQVSHYQPHIATRCILQDEHEDANLLTLCYSAEPGLEIRVRGRYQPVSLRRGELLVMPGEIMSLVTGGLIQPLYHRVRRFEAVRERISVLFFVAPEPDQEIVPWRMSSENRTVDISERIRTNPAKFGLPTLKG
jgi:2OG-Fe(II) oxygenase superfamily